MTMRTTLAAAAILGLCYACVGVTPDEGRCERACASAARCGLLPSALGGRVGLDREHNEADCVARCVASDGGDRKVEELLRVLGAEDFGNAPLCTNGGVDSCLELIETLEDDVVTSELQITTRLEVQMASAASDAAQFTLESLCCFEFEPGVMGDAIDVVYPMFEPTYQCLTQTRRHLDDLHMLLKDTAPTGGPDPMELDALCQPLTDLWHEAEMDPAGPQPTECQYAKLSNQVLALGLPTNPPECQALDELAVDEMRMEVGEILARWNLKAGGLLIEGVDPDGTVRSKEAVRDAMEARIIDEIVRPMGFLEDACRDYDCDDPPAVSPCRNGPMCSEADCLAGSDACDDTLCDEAFSPPGRDCSFFGISTVSLGYRTADGLEVFGDPISDCSGSVTLSTRFDGVKVGVVVPIAVVTGTLPAVFNVDDSSVPGGSFSWIVEGEARYVAAGESTLELPSPLRDFLDFQFENPLEYLGWVPHRLPTGQLCDAQPSSCENYYNDNCEDGLDNDGDGVIDGANAWCDGLMAALSEKCLVAAPGQMLPMGCMGQ